MLESFELLERALPIENCGGFMFMGQHGTVYLYKHGMTRAYLNLADDGKGGASSKCFDQASKTYVSIPMEEAIKHAFDGLEAMGVSPKTSYDAKYRAERDHALAAAGFRTITTSIADGPDIAARELATQVKSALGL